jgi:hypothetical protein
MAAPKETVANTDDKKAALNKLLSDNLKAELDKLLADINTHWQPGVCESKP